MACFDAARRRDASTSIEMEEEEEEAEKEDGEEVSTWHAMLCRAGDAR